ncbi:MAG: hypothetical protein WBV82_04235 [Myxococcaceae bacterium]
MSEPRRATAEVLAPPALPESGAPSAPEPEEPPPFLSTWRNVYLFVVVELAVTVVLFYVLGRWAS